MITLVRQ